MIPLPPSIIKYGFKNGPGGAHTARTMMLNELKLLFSHVLKIDAPRVEYIKAIEEDNCLGKRSVKNRKLTARHLIDLYSLDPSFAIFRALRYFWSGDKEGRPILALLCSYARDSLLRMSAPFVLSISEGEPIRREDLEQYLDDQESDRFSRATLKSTAQNINSTWTQAGHLIGRSKKYRSRAVSTTGSTAYALFLGYVAGVRGAALFESEYIKLLDCSRERAMELAEDASRRGWIVYKRVGDVSEVLFPNLLTVQEMEWILEQH